MRGQTHRPELHLPLTIRRSPETVWLLIVLMMLIGLCMVVFGGMFLQLGPGDVRRYAGLLYVVLCAAIIVLAPACLKEELVLTEEGITYSAPLRSPKTILWLTIERAEARVVRKVDRFGVGSVHEIGLYGSNGSDPVCIKFLDTPFRHQDMMVLRSLITDRASHAQLDGWFGHERQQRLQGNRV